MMLDPAPKPLPEIDGAPGEADARRDSQVEAEAVAGIGSLVPTASPGLLAPRLRTPRFAAFVGLALTTHAAVLAASQLITWSEGGRGRLTGGTGANVLEVDIVEGGISDTQGGRLQDAVAGIRAPRETRRPDQVEAEASDSEHATGRLRPHETTEPPKPVTPPPQHEIALATTMPADTQVATVNLPSPVLAQEQQSTVPIAVAKPFEKDENAEPEPTTRQSLPMEVSGNSAVAESTKAKEGEPGRAGMSPGERNVFLESVTAFLSGRRPANRGWTGHVNLAVVIDYDGVVRSIVVIDSSGPSPMVERAVAAVWKASPFPKPPPGMAPKDLEMRVPMTFHRR